MAGSAATKGASRWLDAMAPVGPIRYALPTTTPSAAIAAPARRIRDRLICMRVLRPLSTGGAGAGHCPERRSWGVRSHRIEGCLTVDMVSATHPDRVPVTNAGVQSAAG